MKVKWDPESLPWSIEMFQYGQKEEIVAQETSRPPQSVGGHGNDGMSGEGNASVNPRSFPKTFAPMQAHSSFGGIPVA